jgi:hypothetical protein
MLKSLREVSGSAGLGGAARPQYFVHNSLGAPGAGIVVGERRHAQLAPSRSLGGGKVAAAVREAGS